MTNQDSYYAKIKKLNVRHYAGETSYYGNADLRAAEKTLLASLPKGARILDIGCGSGRFSINAAKLGFDVTGVDITPEAIATCNKRAKDAGLKNTRFMVVDITEGFPGGNYDYVFCPRFVINAISTDVRRRQAIKNMYAACNVGGKIFIESFNINWLGKGILVPVTSYFVGFVRRLHMLNARLWDKPYIGLLPGDIVYQANKTKCAPEGYAHLPSIFEINSYLRGAKTYSIYELTQVKKKDLLKPFRYSIWTIDHNVQK